MDLNDRRFLNAQRVIYVPRGASFVIDGLKIPALVGYDETAAGFVALVTFFDDRGIKLRDCAGGTFDWAAGQFVGVSADSDALPDTRDAGQAGRSYGYQVRIVATSEEPWLINGGPVALFNDENVYPTGGPVDTAPYLTTVAHDESHFSGDGTVGDPLTLEPITETESSTSAGGDTGVVTNAQRRQVNASSEGQATGNMAQVNASSGNSAATGSRSQVNASASSEASGTSSQVNGSVDSEATNSYSQVNNSFDSSADHTYSQVNASKLVMSGGSHRSVWGWASSGAALAANRKIELHAITGNIVIAGALTSGNVFAGNAELKPNFTEGVLPSGRFLGLLFEDERFGVGLAGSGEFGRFISRAPGSVNIPNDAAFAWQGRYLSDVFGAPIMAEQEIPDPAWDEDSEEPQGTIMMLLPVENPAFNPEAVYEARSARPDMWTACEMQGEAPLEMVSDKIAAGDWIVPGAGGRGKKSTTPSNTQLLRWIDREQLIALVQFN